MEWVLQRSYYARGTNGALFVNGKFVCFTIELPWRENYRKVSCIPEGRYEVKPRISKKFGNHLLLVGVPQRSMILLHPANYALGELKGCIAPVSELSGIGQGLHSRRALERLLVVHRDAVERQETNYLTVTYNSHEFIRSLSKTHPAVFPHPAGSRG
ncbi:DUF5675 family protein [Leeuwenhoekiella blandensis]|uniref:DUF5675 family protein n=1 Tax=Leeuwenhoekiella blandensis TaxID=360293 RepID=UPI00235786E3|nr:DUF5675 family protein [Leeuwenhoekiella blandensis]